MQALPAAAERKMKSCPREAEPLRPVLSARAGTESARVTGWSPKQQSVLPGAAVVVAKEKQKALT